MIRECGINNSMHVFPELIQQRVLSVTQSLFSTHVMLTEVNDSVSDMVGLEF